MDVVSFPGLGIEFSISRVAFTVFGIDIYWYGILIALGVLIGIALALKNAKSMGVDDDKLLDVVLICTIFALISGRAFYVLFCDTFTVSSVKEFFDIRGGGTAFYGVLLGALISSFVVCKIEKIRYGCLLDDLAIGFLLAQGIGRWGNFFNQELFGVNTDLPWGMYSNTIKNYIVKHATQLYSDHGIVLTDGPVHPTFFYEFVWCMIGAVVISRIMKKRRFDGQVFLSYLVWNGVGRAFTESLRTDALFLGNIRISRLVCIMLATISFIIIVVTKNKIKREGDDEYLKCYALTEEWAQEYEASQKKQQESKDKFKQLFGHKAHENEDNNENIE